MRLVPSEATVGKRRISGGEGFFLVNFIVVIVAVLVEIFDFGLILMFR